MGRRVGRTAADAPPWFVEALASLKRRGCNLLVTGAVPRPVAARASGRLLGSVAEDRKRVVALAGSTGHRVEELLPTGVSLGDPDVRVVDRRGGARAVTGAPVSPHADGPAAPTDCSRPDELAAAITRAIRSCEDGDLDPATVRLCLASLTDLVDGHDAAEVRAFVDRTGAAVEDVRGMAHYHLPVPDDAAPVAAVSPAFDARIELRQRSDLAPEHRWHLPDHEPTAWVRL